MQSSSPALIRRITDTIDIDYGYGLFQGEVQPRRTEAWRVWTALVPIQPGALHTASRGSGRTSAALCHTSHSSRRLLLLPDQFSTMGDRSRSRSPGRRADSDRDRPRKPAGGFRWKEKRRDGDDRAEADDRRLTRGYKDREDRARSPRRDRESDRSGDRRREDRYRGEDRERRRPDGEDKEKEERREKKERKEKKEKKKKVIPQSTEPMITVYVNDRLGTRAAIPCLASDPISLFPSYFSPRTLGGAALLTFYRAL